MSFRTASLIASLLSVYYPSWMIFSSSSRSLGVSFASVVTVSIGFHLICVVTCTKFQRNKNLGEHHIARIHVSMSGGFLDTD